MPQNGAVSAGKEERDDFEHVHWPTQPPELQKFVADVQTTLSDLEGVLHGQKTSSTEMPDLRNDFRVLLKADDQYFHSNAMEAIEGDTIVNSLNTLREQILRWREQQHAHS